MHVERILDQARQRLVIVDALASIRDGAGMMSKPGADMLVVCNSGVMVGVITKTDIVLQAGRNPESILSSAVKDIMTRDVAFCRATDHLQDVLLTMRKRGLQRIPAVDAERRPIGVIYGGDALLCLLNEAESEDKALREYISGVGYQ